MNSLADAIVMQNLSVLTRGNTLRHKVLLLGGPNTYLPFFRDCWRKRIPETWERPRLRLPEGRADRRADHRPRERAVLRGVRRGHVRPVRGGHRRRLPAASSGCKNFITHGRASRLGETAGPPLIKEMSELEEFREHYTIPKFDAKKYEPGTKVRVVIGMDGGSTSSKAVLIDYESGEHPQEGVPALQGQPDRRHQGDPGAPEGVGHRPGCELEVMGFGATGYAADVLQESVKSDANIVETVAHMMSATHYFGDIDVICDIGGQDIKVLFMQNGDIKNFRLSNQCSAGNGMLLQAMADQFGVPVTEYADVAFGAKLSPKFCYGCAVFLDSDRVNFQKEGYSKEELLAGLAQVLPKNVWQYVVQIPRMAELGTKFVLQGGTQHNLAALEGAGRLHQGSACPAPRSTCTRTRARPARSAPRWRPGASSCGAASRPSSASITRSTSSTCRRTTKRRAATSARTCARARSSTPRRRTAARRATSAASAARRAPSSRKRRCSRSPRSASS